MMIFCFTRLALIPLPLFVASILAAHAALAQPCEEQTFEDAKFIVCTANPGRDDLRLFWKDARGEPYRRFPVIAKSLSDQGRTLTFAMNAGMYLTDFSPIGLYVENGQEMRPANTKTMEGGAGRVPNFYKKPNGVFFLNDAGAGILPTTDYLKRQPKARFATQSGPMLVIKNKVNPIFIVGSSDRTRRSGVGICGRLVRFAISEGAVNFYDFARLFRDHLSCPDALFLDGGNGVGIYEPHLGRSDMSWHGGLVPSSGLWNDAGVGVLHQSAACPLSRIEDMIQDSQVLTAASSDVAVTGHAEIEQSRHGGCGAFQQFRRRVAFSTFREDSASSMPPTRVGIQRLYLTAPLDRRAYHVGHDGRGPGGAR